VVLVVVPLVIQAAVAVEQVPQAVLVNLVLELFQVVQVVLVQQVQFQAHQ
jgi:hypothetical protein